MFYEEVSQELKESIKILNTNKEIKEISYFENDNSQRC
jgi:hypothetical protein